MNQNRFDRLSQTLADTSLHSRRGILAAVGITVLGALAGVDTDAASAGRKSRRSTKRKTRHGAKARQNATRNQHRSPTLASDKIRCEPFTTCQEAACIDETMLRPACTCSRRGSCECPDDVVCANHLVCQREKGVCLTECRDDFDCAKGATCGADGRCTVATPGPSCDCANLNFCRGNGSCTPDCTCVCDEGWTGASCDTPVNASTCSDHLTCDECMNDTADDCHFCSTTVGGPAVCVNVDFCVILQDGCGEFV